MSEALAATLVLICYAQLFIYMFVGMKNVSELVSPHGFRKVCLPWGELEIQFARHLEYGPSKIIVASLITLVVWFLPLIVVGFSIAGILLIPTDIWKAWRKQRGIDEEKRVKRIEREYEEYRRKGLIESEEI